LLEIWKGCEPNPNVKYHSVICLVTNEVWKHLSWMLDRGDGTFLPTAARSFHQLSLISSN